MKIKGIFKNFNKWQDILLILNTIILIIIVSVYFNIFTQQKNLKLQITNLTNTTIYAEQNDYKIFPIDELLTIEFNKDKMIQAYKDSIYACRNYPREGTGSLYICQDEYFEKSQDSLKDGYSKINDFCRKNVIQAARSECMDNVLEAIENNEYFVKIEKENLLND